MSLDLRALIDFVDTEFRSQFRHVIDLITLPIPRRVDQFTCWPGLRVVESSESRGKLTLSFKTNPSKLRVGEHVYVNPQAVESKDVISGPEGIIQSIDEQGRRVVIQPGYQQGHRFGRRFRLDDPIVLDQTLPAARLGREMPILALRLLSGEFGSHPRIERIRGLLEGGQSARETTDQPPVFDGDASLEHLSPAQREALRQGIESDFAMIQGPPGTGKTHLLGLLIRELVRRGKKVAVCAFTHQGINNVLEECLTHEEISEVSKLGKPSSWTGTVDRTRLKLVERPGAFFRTKNTPDVTGFTQHAAFNPVSRALTDGVEEAMPGRFDVLIFDEAGQLTLPAAVMAMYQADRFVFAGDHRQLPPVVSTGRPGEGAAISVFQHLVEEAGHEPMLLDQSFRLNAELTEFPGRVFYGGLLKSAPSAQKRRLEIDIDRDSPHGRLLDPDRPSQLALVRHECRGQESPEEAALVTGLVEEAIRGGVPASEIAVIAPHRRQNVKIREMLASRGLSGAHPMVDTVERIQGRERDLIILSMTLSDPDVLSAEADFLFLPHRFNVAITRARRKLIVVASARFFRTLPRPEALAARGRSPLTSLNVLKRWYFEHRSTAIDATTTALSNWKNATADSGRVEQTQAHD